MEHHVGAAPLPLPPGVRAGAVFGAGLSGSGPVYRYSLDWHMTDFAPDIPPSKTVMFLLMNPSVADHQSADRTVLKCWRYAQTWGCTRMLIGNSAAYRATDQRRLAEVADPVGKDNPWWLRRMAQQSGLIVVAHGKPQAAAARAFGPAAVAVLRKAGHALHTLRLSKDGTPEHPLYLPGNLRPQIWMPTP